jgi:hypothetical protein
MARTGTAVVTAAILALAAVLFVPAFSEAAGSLDTGALSYGAEVQLILDNFPVLLAALALLVLGAVIIENT